MIFSLSTALPCAARVTYLSVGKVNRAVGEEGHLEGEGAILHMIGDVDAVPLNGKPLSCKQAHTQTQTSMYAHSWPQSIRFALQTCHPF